MGSGVADQMTNPYLSKVYVKSSCFFGDILRVGLHDECLRRLGEHEFEWGAARNFVDLSVVRELAYARLQVPIIGVFFYILAEPGKAGAVVPLDLSISLRVANCREHVLDPHESIDKLEKSRGELLAIIGQEHARRAVGHKTMGDERFCHTLGRDSLERNRTDEF